jgi:hypothetical protein
VDELSPSHSEGAPEDPALLGSRISVGQVFGKGPQEVVDPWWYQECHRRGLNEFLFRRWAIDVEEPLPELLEERLPEALSVVRRSWLMNSRRLEFTVEHREALAIGELGPRSLWVGVAGTRLEDLREVLGLLTEAFPEHKPTGDDRAVMLAVWSSADAGRVFRPLKVQPWDEIASNYAPETAEALGRLVHGFEPRGRLLIWHGPPGTGKSYALGALAHAWRDWAVPYYVADPELLLADPGYLLEVLLVREARDERWRLVIMEDAGELFGADARSEIGQGLSRLLNTTDGMLGHGSKTLFVITTNEPIQRFHPAVTRPGRCAAIVSFDPLPPEQARAWLRQHGAEEAARRLSCPATLAELYAMRNGAEPPPERPAVGFRRG